MLLKVEHLNAHYGRAHVLHDISAQVEEGELVCMVGRNGAGKTTFLKTVGGFIKPSSGEITFRNQEISDLSLEKVALQGIRYVFQDKRVFGELTVRENIELAAFPVKEPLDQAIGKMLKIHPKMEKLLDSKAKGLSGGERQILLIGRALIGNPQLLLIDEPTEGLAAIIIGQIIDILLQMKAKVSMMVVEQNLATVSRLADRIYIMKEGVIVREIDDAKTIQNPPAYEEDL
jgi:ABC-type branched-subunit amino acid transport system ATPase component